ncbi:metalloproteinase inhibitor 2-like [Entelurus aequoreus]|uniref:metalloproteinase inhibitor 2-like n=1 Tax=Entelurus aequoreus TaxID=161455 RepID=UPI002B1D9013|nr:metalloproteinase inhibitor 2-like [Entelurus aequoreus]
MMSWMKCCVFPLVLLCMWRLQEGAQACTCAPVHPQTAFCQADVVILAKVVSKMAGVTEFADIKYTIDQTKMFKGPQKIIDAIYSAPFSAACGVTLTVGEQYFITGRLISDGSLHVSLCNYVVPWESMSATQKILVERYMMGCDCKITRCRAVPCGSSGPAECLWSDLLTLNSISGEQDKQSACIKRSDGSCSWYKATSPKKAN